MHAFFNHHVLNDLSKAKKLYKEALKRTEYTKGCYNMMTSIYLVESMQQSWMANKDGAGGGPRDSLSIDLAYLEAKLESLESKYGHFLRYEKSLVGQKDRLIQ